LIDQPANPAHPGVTTPTGLARLRRWLGPAPSRLNLALQGGGAHGAFTWGVLDALLEDQRIRFEGLSGSSAGAMNAVVFADGWMKGGRDGGRSHSLPIPPNALSVLERFHQEAGGDSPWMFPSKDSGKPVTPSALNLLIYRLQGRVFDPTVKRKPNRPGKPGPKPSTERKIRENLFEKYGIRHWSPHDVRRTMTTFLTDHRLGGAAAAILGHKMPHEDVSEREMLAPVTELHYNLSQKIDLKAEGMKLWIDALLTAYRREARTLKHSANKKESLKSPSRSRKSLSTEAVIA
jgi:Predicted esterase of the alpha-beta hydrolase superfamily